MMTLMSPEDTIRLHVIVEGRVQGVGFREFVLRNALSLDLSGWVRNVHNGNVEVLAEGNRHALENLQDFLRQGPSAATVTNLQLDWSEASGEFTTFIVARTLYPNE
jgi:acylphosphatase